MKYQFNLGNDELVAVDKDKVEEFTTNNPNAKFSSFVDDDAVGKTDPSKETEDAPVEGNNTASRLEDGSLVYQESSVGELVNKIQEAERQGEAVLFPPGVGDLDKIALEEVIIGIEKPQEKSIKDQQTLAKRMAKLVYQPSITVAEELKEDILDSLKTYKKDLLLNTTQEQMKRKTKKLL